MSANSNIVSSISSQKPSESRKVDISTRAFWFLFPLKFFVPWHCYHLQLLLFVSADLRPRNFIRACGEYAV